MTTAHWISKIKVIGQGQSLKGQCKNVRATRVSTLASYEYWLMAIVAGLHCDVISCELARRGAWRARPRPAAEAESSACGCDSAVSLSLIARGQFFSSWTCCGEKDVVHKSGKMDRRLNSIQTAWPSYGQSYYIVYITHLMMPIETIMSDVASFLYTPILYYKRSRSAVADYKSC